MFSSKCDVFRHQALMHEGKVRIPLCFGTRRNIIGAAGARCYYLKTELVEHEEGNHNLEPHVQVGRGGGVSDETVIYDYGSFAIRASE
jgi:hypothetical protein